MEFSEDSVNNSENQAEVPQEAENMQMPRAENGPLDLSDTEITGDNFTPSENGESADGVPAEEGTGLLPDDWQEDQTAQDTEDSENPAADSEESEEEPEVLVEFYSEPSEEAVQTKRENRKGIVTYAAVMTVCFLISLVILIATMIVGGRGETVFGSSKIEKTIYVREVGSSEEYRTVQEIITENNGSVVAISIRTATGSGTGTGMILTEDGYIATNYHVIENATTVTVKTYSGDVYSAEVVGYSADDDLAVIRITAKGLTPVTFGDSSSVMAGDNVVVIGHPAGMEFGWTATTGIISAVNRDVKIRDSEGVMTKRMTLLQTSASVNKGNSGGPMFNDRGEVIGVITMKLVDGYEGMGFAIPSSGAKEILDAIMEKGSAEDVESKVSAKRPVLGISGVSVYADHWYRWTDTGIQMLSEEEAAVTEGAFYAPISGVAVSDTVDGSDARRVLRREDIIFSLGNTTVTNFEELRSALYEYNGGDTIRVGVRRDGVDQTVELVLGTADD